MGTLVRLGVLAGVGGMLYNWFRKREQPDNGFGDTAPVHSSGVVRNAGPEDQQGIDNRNWDKVDEQIDESFPASDPPSTY